MRIPSQISRAGLIVGLTLASVFGAYAQTPSAPIATTPQNNLYVIELKTGPAWDSSKQPHEQENFREHSTNLKALRDQGKLALGARYGDKGLIVVESPTEAEARAMFDQDASIAKGVFAYTLFEFNVFYGGTVATKKRKP